MFACKIKIVFFMMVHAVKLVSVALVSVVYYLIIIANN